MLEKPNISDEDLIQALDEAYDISVTELTFLPIGYDATASVYSVTGQDQQRHFLKLKHGALNPPSYLVPRLLKSSGIHQIVAPLPTRDEALWHNAVDKPYSLILYPYVEGQTGYDAKLTLEQWHELGQILGRIHAAPFETSDLGPIRHESFELHPQWGANIARINALLDKSQAAGTQLADPYQQELASFWRSKRTEIDQIVARLVALGKRCQQKPQRMVLCHADFHIFNVLVSNGGDDSESALHIVDWDETVIAPIERDLMFVVGQAAGRITVENESQAAFLQGYGCTVDEIDPVVMAYYRYEWVVQEFGDFGERVFFNDDFGEETKADSVKEFIALFDPGDVVEGAYRSDVN